MIISFKHKGLERYFTKNEKRGLNQQHIKRIARILDRLDSAEVIKDMDLPGYGLHALLGNKHGIWSVKVSANWRLTFKLSEGEASEVNLEDYH